MCKAIFHSLSHRTLHIWSKDDREHSSTCLQQGTELKKKAADFHPAIVLFYSLLPLLYATMGISELAGMKKKKFPRPRNLIHQLHKRRKERERRAFCTKVNCVLRNFKGAPNAHWLVYVNGQLSGLRRLSPQASK